MKVSKKEGGRKLQKLQQILRRQLKIKGKKADFFILKNFEMEGIRKELRDRPDFKGSGARKIRRERQVTVLAFPEPTGFPAPKGLKRLGEIYLNYEAAEGDLDRLIYLFIHGFLHLLGYDHMGIRDRIEMEKLEKELFLKLIPRLD